MKYGLIGCPLSHSWSSEIHAFLTGIDYQLCELLPEQIDDFFAKKDFKGINVTIPYKETVIPYLDELDDSAKAVGAVNCIINRNGKLKGYNTDYSGFIYLVKNNGINVSGRKVAVLGSGGGSKAVKAALLSLNAEPIRVSRTGKDECITYEELYREHAEISVIVNTTPVGLYPNTEEVPVDLFRFENLEAVIDIIANPLRSRLVLDARNRGIKYASGLEMLVAQAFAADQLFLNRKLDPDMIEKCIRHLMFEKRNIVLIGMPSAGKTTVGRMAALAAEKKFVDLDEEIEKEIGMPINSYFALYGEEEFRRLESEMVKRYQNQFDLILAPGGGIIKNAENMYRLAHNGIIIRIDRRLELLQATSSRPLSSNAEALKQLYQERTPLYEYYSDCTCSNNGDLGETVAEIITIMKGER